MAAFLSSEDQPETSISFVVCQREKLAYLHKVETNDADKNLKGWAKTNKDFQLFGRLLTSAPHAHAAESY